MARVPLPSDRIYPPIKLAALVEVLAEQGIPAESCLAGVGISVQTLGDASARTSVRQYAQACMNALRLGCDSSTPFRVGGRLHLFAYGMYGYALMSGAVLRDYFTLGTKYHLLATPTLTIEWREEAGCVVWLFPDEFNFAPTQILRQFLIEQQFAQQVTHLQDVAGQRVLPSRACFSYPAPAHAELYAQYLGCECVFDWERCELRYPSEILEQKAPLAHQLTSAMFQETCDKLMAAAASSTGVAGEVYQLLIRAPGRFPDMDAIASRLNMTTRTLRRHLLAEDMTFSDILDDVRRSLTMEYFRSTSLSIDDIARLVGFTDTANFRRAFKRWTGQNPGAVRRDAKMPCGLQDALKRSPQLAGRRA